MKFEFFLNEKNFKSTCKPHGNGHRTDKKKNNKNIKTN